MELELFVDIYFLEKNYSDKNLTFKCFHFEESTSEQTTFKGKKPIQARRLLENVVSTQKHHVCLHEGYKSATYW